jgi:hypothetical protein
LENKRTQYVDLAQKGVGGTSGKLLPVWAATVRTPPWVELPKSDLQRLCKSSRS